MNGINIQSRLQTPRLNQYSSIFLHTSIYTECLKSKCCHGDPAPGRQNILSESSYTGRKMAGQKPKQIREYHVFILTKQTFLINLLSETNTKTSIRLLESKFLALKKNHPCLSFIYLFKNSSFLFIVSQSKRYFEESHLKRKF